MVAICVLVSPVFSSAWGENQYRRPPLIWSISPVWLFSQMATPIPVLIDLTRFRAD